MGILGVRSTAYSSEIESIRKVCLTLPNAMAGSSFACELGNGWIYKKKKIGPWLGFRGSLPVSYIFPPNIVLIIFVLL